jgi:hypothetical protein
MIQALTPDGTDQAFDVRILPGRSWLSLPKIPKALKSLAIYFGRP